MADKVLRYIQNISLGLDLIRSETHDGRDHLVVPVVAVVEGVLNGEFVPIDEFEAALPLWEGVPVPLSHPTIFGQDVSANEQAVRDQFNVGWFFNVKIDGDRFVGEIWVDIEKAESLEDGRVLLERLKDGTEGPIEVSTAYWRVLDETTGVHNGDDFVGVQRNIIPDHLAILLHEEGACSVADGCGAKRNSMVTNCECNRDNEKHETTVRVNNIQTNVISVNDIRSSLNTEISDAESSFSTYVVDIFVDGHEGNVIYERFSDQEGFEILSREFEFSPDYSEVTLGESVEVRQVTSYEPVTNQSQEDELDREQLIEQLISNEDVQLPDEVIRSLDDSGLRWAANQAGVEVPEEEEEVETPEPVAPAADPAPVAEATPATPEATNSQVAPELVRLLNSFKPEEIAAAVTNAKQQSEQSEAERVGIISKLKANKAVRMSDSMLDGLNLNQAQELAKQFMPVTYAGVRGPSAVNAEVEDMPRPKPVLLQQPSQ